MNLLPSKQYSKYLKNGRLSDVLALIQVLALDSSTYRSDSGIIEGTNKGLEGELQGKPVSADKWSVVAIEHPEFFRVNQNKKNAVSLVARHVTPKNDNGVRVLPNEFIGKLLELAVHLHDRQIKLAERWTYLVPIWVSLISALGAILVAFLYKS